MMRASKAYLVRSMSDALDKSEYCGVIGDTIITHPELVERLRDTIGCAVANAIVQAFTPDATETEETTLDALLTV